MSLPAAALWLGALVGQRIQGGWQLARLQRRGG
jgi:hypothetical protein